MPARLIKIGIRVRLGGDKKMDSELIEFWEKCGFTYFQTNSGWVWVCPDGETQVITLPPITLDNLFKYEPLTAQGYHIEIDTYKREVDGLLGQASWVTIKKDEKLIVSFTDRELVQALYKALSRVV